MKIEFLRQVPLFSGMTDADLLHLNESVREVRLSAGEVLVEEGDPGDRAYIIEEGELEVFKQAGDREVLIALRKSGEVVGEMALLEEEPRMATVRGRTGSVLLAIEKEQLDHLLSSSISAANAMFRNILERWRGTEGMLRQSEKMAQLGTLTAGVAHELNNPAAAVARGAGQAREGVENYAQAQSRVIALGLTGIQQQVIQALTEGARVQAARPPELDAMVRSDREYELEEWLEDRGVEDAWELAPDLVNLDCGTDCLAQLEEHFKEQQLTVVVGWLNATYVVYNLLTEIGQGAGRIAGIVKALKSYSYLDQAPVQAVDVNEGLDNTLLILRSKLKEGISVRREYSEDLPRIQAYGSELNQVWTNLIDNAVDALDGQGEIILRTRQDGESVVVEVEDNGPGIPEEIQARIFDAFFTTKPPGKGTGLGLDISYRIVVDKHRGDMTLHSRPGRTRFQVRLRVDLDAD